MDHLGRAQFATEFLARNPGARERLTKMFGEDKLTNDFWRLLDYNIIKGISENKELFFKYFRNNFEKHYNILETILTSVQQDCILLFFSDLHLYAIAKSLTDLRNFIQQLYDIKYEFNLVINISQIILSTQPQKLIFCCSQNSDDVQTNLRRYIQITIYRSQWNQDAIYTIII